MSVDKLRREQIGQSLEIMAEEACIRETRDAAKRLLDEIIEKKIWTPRIEREYQCLMYNYLEQVSHEEVGSGYHKDQNIKDNNVRMNASDVVSDEHCVGRRNVLEGMKKTDAAFDVVIEALEGGYYNPALHGPDGYSKETYFGIDRGWRGDGEYAKLFDQFWRIIDEYTAKQNSNIRRNARFPDEIDTTLKKLTNQMMKIRYERMGNTYLSNEQRDLIEAHPQLMIHFVYALWNGDVVFRELAKIVGKAMKSGGTRQDIVNQAHVAIHNYRMNLNNWSAITGAKLALLAPPPGIDVVALSDRYLKGKFSRDPIKEMHTIAAKAGRNIRLVTK